MKLRALAVGLAAAAITAGCAVVPTSGPVHPAPGLPAGAGESVVGVIARPPRAGMTPVAIVTGYLDAMASPTGNYAIAREYLTPERAQEWNPQLRTVVYDGPGTLEQEANARVVRLTSERVGVIDNALRWSAAESADQLDVVFNVVRTTSGWRINAAPDGLLLTGGDVSRGYRGFPIYFPAPGSKVLVADGALIPVESSNTATLLTRLLLDGPGSWLQGAVGTGFPRGTRLAVDSVPIVNGVAQVRLTDQALSATNAQRTTFAAQLTSTLTAVQGVFSVSITVAGQPLTIPHLGNPLAVDQWTALLPDAQSPTVASIMTSSGAKLFNGQQLTPLKGASRAGIVANPVMNLARTRIVGLTAGRVAVLARVDGSRPVNLRGSTDVTDLSFDRFGRIWGVRAGSLRAWEANGEPTPVIMPADVKVDRFAMAPDGVRIAISRIVAGASQLFVGAIARRADGLHLQGLHAISRNSVSPGDVSWTDELQVAVLVVAPSVSIFSVNTLSGENSRFASVQQAVDIAASARGGILVGTSAGMIWQTTSTFPREIGPGRQPSFGG